MPYDDIGYMNNLQILKLFSLLQWLILLIMNSMHISMEGRL